jgi:hypothetical protein
MASRIVKQGKSSSRKRIGQTVQKNPEKTLDLTVEQQKRTGGLAIPRRKKGGIIRRPSVQIRTKKGK